MRLVRPMLVLAGATLSCQVILGLEEPKANAPPMSDATAAIDAGPSDDPCPHQLPAKAPLKDDDLDTKEAFWLATVRFDAPLKPDAGVQPGFDLDNSCTCKPDRFDGGPTCTTPAGTGVTCDFPNGVDDAFGTIAKEFAQPYPGFDPMGPVNRQLADGIRTLLVYVKDYNGKANDSDVGVEFANSGGLYSNLGCDGAPRANRVTFNGSDEGSPGTRYAPLHDGCDRWSPADGATIGSYPKVVTPRVGSAYVSNFDLVVSFRETGASLFGGATKLSNGYTVARLSKDANGKMRAEGVLAGRIAFVDLLDLIGRTPVDNKDDGGKQAFCETPFWGPIAKRFCSARDVMVSPAEERLGKVCDATSSAVGFTLVQAEVSDVPFTNLQETSTCQNSSIQCP